MAGDVDTLKKLLTELAAGKVSLDRLDHYYRHGYYDNLDVPANARTHYRRLIESAVTNWLGLVVDTTAERLIVDGFRSPDADVTDADIWQWWQANRLDARQMQLNTEASKAGEAYVSVWPAEAEDAPPLIIPNAAGSVLVKYDNDLDPSRATSAVKSRGEFAWFYTPEAVYRYKRLASTVGTSEWFLDAELENPLGAVPFVRFAVNLSLDGTSASDLDAAIPVQNRITETTVDRLLASRLSAFRQRYAIGLELDVDADGNPIAPFDAAVDRLWTTEDPDVKFGEFGEATLSNYIGAVAADVHHLAAVTRTPPHYLLGQMTNLSAEALVAAETGLARKVAERQQTFGEAWEDVMRLAQRAAGRDEVVDLETVWRRTETVSDAQVVDAALKLTGLDVPTEALWQRIGATPQQIIQWRRMARADALRDSLRRPLVNDGAADPDTEEPPAA